jgi:alkylation response protein AidB-like acyl-CoA dehydrogenase
MEHPIQRYVRDSLVLPIGGGTSQILKNVIAGRLGVGK